MTQLFSKDGYPIAAVTRTTAFAIAPKWCEYTKLFFAGYNLYAIDDDNRAALIETFDTEKEARTLRRMIVEDVKCGAEIVFV